MRKQTISLTILIIIIAVAAYYFATTYEPTEDLKYYNVSVSARYDKERVATGFTINGVERNTSKTYELVKVLGGEVSIKNINIGEQDFYEEERVLNISKNMRIDLILKRSEEVFFDIQEGNPINVTLNSKNFLDVIFCLDGSPRYLFIKPQNNYTEIDKPEGFSQFEKCYDGGFSLEDSNHTLEISYLQIGEVSEDDFIDLVVIDFQGNSKKQKIK